MFIIIIIIITTTKLTQERWLVFLIFSAFVLHVF